jgi:hypothetical protein
MTRNRLDGAFRGSYYRWAFGLLLVLLCVASSRLPVESSTQRFGKERSKRARSYPSEHSSASLQVKAVQGNTNTQIENDPERSQPRSAPRSFQPLSPLTESRLALGDRRPDYLKFFDSSSPHSCLPPPPAA